MITDILYRCPLCGGFDWLGSGRCTLCHGEVQVLSRSEVSVNGEKNTIGHWYDKIRSFDLPSDDTGTILKSSRVILSRETTRGIFRGFAGVVATHFTRAASDEGSFILKTGEIIYTGGKEAFTLPFDDLCGVTIESNTIILISRGQGILFFDFQDESGKKWEDLIRKALEVHHLPGKIVEFYPRLKFENALNGRHPKAPGHKTLSVPVRKWYAMDTSIPLAVVRAVAKPIIKALFSVRIEGLDNIPGAGAAVLLSNHTSFLDSIILGAFPKRHIWFMAKNSELRNPLLTWAIRHARGFPVRRYTIDTQAVRNAIRIVQQGHILGIYPEGERTWDNRLLPFKRGTMRLVLALGKPVIPVGISGSYALMPRWESSIERTPVKVRIGETLTLPHIPIPQQTNRDITDAEQVLSSRIRQLSGEIH